MVQGVLQVHRLINSRGERFYLGHLILGRRTRSGPMSTLFSVGFKRKATATAEEVEQADAARKAREAEDAARLKAACAEKQAAVAGSLDGVLGIQREKKPSMTKDAVRMRKVRTKKWIGWEWIGWVDWEKVTGGAGPA